jgi:hypothetical protein
LPIRAILFRQQRPSSRNFNEPAHIVRIPIVFPYGLVRQLTELIFPAQSKSKVTENTPSSNPYHRAGNIPAVKLADDMNGPADPAAS